jgi:Zn2+/Cd2+-exporting ATPase
MSDGCAVCEHDHDHAPPDPRAQHRRRWLLAASAGLFAVGMGVEWLTSAIVVGRVLFSLSIAIGAPPTAAKAWRSLGRRSLDINVLMLVSAAGAVFLGQWSEGTAVVFLFAVAQELEVITLDRARHAVGALVNLTPADALVRGATGNHRMPVDRVSPGAIIAVQPGEKIPLDGRIEAGESEVNQAPVTGESVPVDKVPGDDVFAGSINGRGALDILVTRFGNDTTLARIMHLVEHAQEERAPSQQYVERFARVYTPAVLALAVAVAAVPPLVGGGDWHVWLYRALVLLVISCPCALVISTPVSVVAALAGAARKGVLIKGGAHLERAAHVRCVAFDKTGTLTRGTPEVVDVVSLTGLLPQQVASLAAAVEQRSTHPIARAIVQYAERASLAVAPGIGVAALSGLGAEGLVGSTRVVLGNHRLFEERNLCSDAVHAQLDRLNAMGATPVLVAQDGEAVGLIGVADRPREEGRAAVAMLRRAGIERLAMLTGDHESTARAIAAHVGVDEVCVELLPEDKVAAIESLRRRFGPVAMVGDGINDAPALAAADLGIVMGAAGSGAALETADIALMADDLLKIPYALRLSRATLRNIKVNLGIALALKAAFVVASIAGVATLWMAVLADTGATVIVIANALTLLRAD